MTDLERRIWLRTREELVEILENHGIQCYDSEGKEVLVEALRVNIDDGTIPEDVLGEYE